MRPLTRLLICILIAIPLTVFAAEQKATMTVNGRCNACKKRIEKAAESIEGVKDATWDKKTHLLTAVYDDATTSDTAIRTAILNVGYDVDSLTAPQEAYDDLPECCMYR